MKAVLYNRILIFLGFAGIFVAGVLSLAKVMNVVPPCGAASSCEKVTNDASSMFLGVLPVAYIGLAAYLILTTLAVVRSLPRTPNFLQSVLGGYVISAGGMLISLGLQFYSITVIGALCKWCLASAIIMTLTLIVYALLYQDAAELTETQLREVRTRSRGAEFLFRTSLVGVTLLALAAMGYTLKNSDNAKGRVLTNLPKNFPLIPKNPNYFGDLNAPVKVIEFADLNCSACQKYSPMLKEYARQHKGAMVIIFRHCPLPMHKTSQLAAAIDCYAAEKGKFWDYTMAVMGTKKEVEDPNELFTLAGSVGLDVNDLRRRLADTNDPLYKQLTVDENTAAAIGVTQTPTFIVQLPGKPPKVFSGGGMIEAFSQRPYSDYLGKT